ncbi:hypothetical protein PISMIDRAFT_353558 [Pisolithus microcarpus 441]|uniref:Uncharacterized protein n=1 Tax=Pisolithus microcarpus 441 TaxID=765257 RepID=A0A0C9YJM7_9AGAM|nr:hypothetical protein PISMIDRAFT_353558 [Pisolithus microcarpus 441]
MSLRMPIDRLLSSVPCAYYHKLLVSAWVSLARPFHTMLCRSVLENDTLFKPACNTRYSTYQEP